MGLLDTVKDVVTLIQKADNLDLLRRALDLQNEASRVSEENHGLKARVIELTDRVTQLESELKRQPQMEFRAPFWYAPNDGMPHCPRCWEADHRAIHLSQPLKTALGDVYSCAQCSKQFTHNPRTSSPSNVSFSR
jgi:hypothetical protein